MEIYVVQYGDDIESIANRYGISVERLVSDNGLTNPNRLVIGQTLIILHPKEIYTVKSGDTLKTIAEQNGISLMQLLRNNPFLYGREYIYENETLVISFNTIRDIQTNAFTDETLSQDTLSIALPYLTYLSIYSYRINYDTASIITYFDDTPIIKMAKQYDTTPLLMISALSLTGEINLDHLYELLLDNALQNELIREAYQILKSKEYMGVNFVLSYITDFNQSLYLNVIEKISLILRNEGYLFMVTINPNFSAGVSIDYKSISLLVDRIILLENLWPKLKQPPGPISNISLIRPYIENVTSEVSSNFFSIGKPLIAINWITTYDPNSKTFIMSLNSAIELAYDENSEIQLDEVSQTPYFYYNGPIERINEEHVVWFIDARSIKAANDVILDYDLLGTGLWNLRSYYQQLFSIIAATFNIVKFPLQ